MGIGLLRLHRDIQAAREQATKPTPAPTLAIDRTSDEAPAVPPTSDEAPSPALVAEHPEAPSPRGHKRGHGR